jgi:PAS domain S-box-containing protein
MPQLSARDFTLYETLIQSNILGMLTWNNDGQVVEANEYALNLLGYGRKELVERQIPWNQSLPHLVTQGPIQTEYCRADGSRIPILVGGALLPTNTSHGICFVLDLSELKTAQEALKMSEGRHRALAEHSAVAILNTTLDFKLLYANPTFLKWLGLSSCEELASYPLSHFFTESGFSHVLENKQERMDGRASVYESELRSIDGRVTSILISGAPVLNSLGETESIIATFVDITEIKRTVSLLKTIVESVPDGILVTDDEGRVLVANRKFIEIWNIPPELIALGNYDLLVQHSLQQMVAPEEFLRLRAEYDSQNDAPATSFQLKDGRWVEIYRRSEALPPAGRVRVISVRDISERKNVEERLIHADRMSVVGTLAAGVAHEVNNPLTHLICGLELLERKLARTSVDEKINESVQALIRSASRIAEIVKDLKTFSRSGAETLDHVDVRLAIESTLPLIASELKLKAQLRTTYLETPPVLANEGRLSQVFLNLMVNAFANA